MRQFDPFGIVPHPAPYPLAFLPLLSCSGSESESESPEDDELLLLSESLDESLIMDPVLFSGILSSKPNMGMEPGAVQWLLLGLLLGMGDLACGEDLEGGESLACEGDGREYGSELDEPREGGWEGEHF